MKRSVLLGCALLAAAGSQPGAAQGFGSFGGFGVSWGSPRFRLGLGPVGWGGFGYNSPGWITPPAFTVPGFVTAVPPAIQMWDPVRVWPWYPFGYAGNGGSPISFTTNVIYNGAPAAELLPPPASAPAPADPAPDPVPAAPPLPRSGERFYLERPAASPRSLTREQLRVERLEPGVYLVRYAGEAGQVARLEVQALGEKDTVMETRELNEAPFRTLFRLPGATERVVVKVESRAGAASTLSLPVAEFRALARD